MGKPFQAVNRCTIQKTSIQYRHSAFP